MSNMVSMARNFLFIILAFSFNGYAEWGENSSLKNRKSHEIQRLRERKQAFDLYIKSLKSRDEERQSHAFKMKKIRSEYNEFKISEQKKFKRTNYDFPYEAYKKFIVNRDKSREVNRKSRIEYSQIQKELDKIREDKKYQINGKKEYNL